jgi:hypothetical protein
MSELIVRDVPEPLSGREQKLLVQLEADIEQNLKGFKKVGYALTVIRDQQLYRVDYDTFEEYCREVWDLGRPRAYQLMGGYAVVENLSTIVDKTELPSFDLLPATESQARPLTILAPDQQIAVWQMVIDMAKEQGCKITAALVQQCIHSLNHKKLDESLNKARNTGSGRPEKVLPDEIQEAFQSFLSLVQREADNNWRQVGKRELAAALREVLQALEE